MKSRLVLMLLAVITVLACKKEYKATPTYAKFAIAATWAKPEQFYSPNPETYIEATATWRKFSSFSVTSEGEPDKIGFANPYVAGRGTNALYFNTLYGTNPGLTADSGYYNVTIPKCFQFIPSSADHPETGSVIVLPQQVRAFRKNGTPFFIGIGPSTNPGTYDTRTGVFEIEIQFDETDIGGAKDIKRKYRFTS